MDGFCGDCGVIFGSGKAVICGCFFCEGPEAVVLLGGFFSGVSIGFAAGYTCFIIKGLMIERSWGRADK